MPIRVRFERPPLVFALGQVVMSDVLKMGSCVPDIQDELRKHGFPLYQQQDVNQVEIGPGREPSFQKQTRWVFRSEDQRDAVTLTSQGFVVQTSNYKGFEAFLATIAKVADAVWRATNVALCTRLGLRYIDLIGPREEASTLLDRSLLGLRQELVGGGMRTMMKRLEQVDATPVGGSLVMRVSETIDGAFLPPDLGPAPVLFEIERPPEAGEPSVLLDLDHFLQMQFPFEAQAVAERFETLHDILEERFFSVLTDDAYVAWGAPQVAS